MARRIYLGRLLLFLLISVSMYQEVKAIGSRDNTVPDTEPDGTADTEKSNHVNDKHDGVAETDTDSKYGEDDADGNGEAVLSDHQAPPKTRRNRPFLCDLHPVKTNIVDEIDSARTAGGVQLIKYTLNFNDKEDYPYNPLTSNMTTHFAADQWQTVFSKHGRTLLSLAFNYDALSLLMLTFGVQDIHVDLVDSPAGCFGKLSEDNKISVVRELIMDDFKPYNEEESPMGKDEEVCHQIIKNNKGVADFTFECCQLKESSGNPVCDDDMEHTYIDALYILMAVIKIAFLLFGPIAMQKWFYSDPGELRKAPYVIKLNEALRKSLLVKKVAVDNPMSSGQQREMKQFRKFRELLKSIPSDDVVQAKFEKLHILVDHHKLVSEKKVPVGLFHFLYSTFLRCGLRRYEPFAACCKQSIFGSWSPRFLWLPLKRDSDCNKSCGKCLSWERLFRALGALIIVASIPLPYYIRIILYYQFEEEELEVRWTAAERMNLDITYDHNLFQYLTPTHAFMIALYITYCVTFILLACFRFCDSEKFDDIARGALQDLKTIKRMECIRLLLAHLLLPLEKFGLCGLVIGLVYWPIALPICLLVSICYCIPTLYLTGRFCLQRRPMFLATMPMVSRINRRSGVALPQTLSEGTSSFETAMLLENISPRDLDKLSSPQKHGKKKWFTCDTQKWGSRFVTLIVGILFVLYMYCLLLMFAECFGVAVEIFVLTLMGTIVNASSAARYVMLAFWVMMYSSNCYNRSYSKYARLNRKLFDFIKSKLNEDVQAVTLYREEKQQNTAFKYFTVPELRQMHDHDVEIDMSSETDAPPQTGKGGTQRDVKNRGTIRHDVHEDSVEYMNGKLSWNINCLIFFVDKKDRPRIPRELFTRICEIKAPGCPGPVHQSLLKATKQLMYMIIFLIFVFLVVLSFGEFYEISTTNQMLLTLSSGFVPFVVRFVLSPKVEELNLNTYSFSGKIYHIIQNFSQTWPVYDLSFKCWSPDLGGGMFPPGASGGSPGGATALPQPSETPFGDSHRGGRAPDVIDPSHVDLLITIRDDQYDDMTEHRNLRSEPGSLGSLNSGLVMRGSPDDQPKPHGAATNNPTNATLLQRSMGTPEQGGAAARDSGGAFPRNMPMGASPHSTRQTPQRRVDLVIDISKGGVQVHDSEQAASDAGSPARGGASASGGIAMWPMRSTNTGSRSSPTGKETESAL